MNCNYLKCVLSVHVNNAQQGKNYLNKMFSMKQNNKKIVLTFVSFQFFESILQTI